MRSNLSSGFLKLLPIQTGGAFPPFPSTLPHKTCRWWRILCQALVAASCPTLSQCFQLLLSPAAPYAALCVLGRAHPRKNKELAFKINWKQRFHTSKSAWLVLCGAQISALGTTHDKGKLWSKLRLQTPKESCWNNMVIYARAWHTGSRLCIRKGPLELLIPAEIHNVIVSTFEQKKPPRLGLSPPFTCMCGVGDPSHQTPRARDKCDSPFSGSRNQAPCSCVCTGRSSLAPSRIEGQVYFSKPFTNLSHEKIDPRNPWIADKENITGWSDVCLRVLQATSTSQIWSSLFISEKSYLDSKNGGWSLLAFKQSLLILPLLWKPLLLGEFCLDNFHWGQCNGSYWHLLGPKHLLSLPVCSSWHRQGPFHIWWVHRERWLRGFCGGSKIELFYPYFCIHKIHLTPVSHVQSAKAVWKHFQVCLKVLVSSLLLPLLSRDFPKGQAHTRQSVHLKRQKPKAFQSVSE